MESFELRFLNVSDGYDWNVIINLVWLKVWVFKLYELGRLYR